MGCVVSVLGLIAVLRVTNDFWESANLRLPAADQLALVPWPCRDEIAGPIPLICESRRENFGLCGVRPPFHPAFAAIEVLPGVLEPANSSVHPFGLSCGSRLDNRVSTTGWLVVDVSYTEARRAPPDPNG
jgi:hypothetical protein